MQTAPPAPPRRPRSPRFDGDPGPAQWVASVLPYLTARNAKIRAEDPAALLEWLRLCHLRDAIPAGRRDRRSAPDSFGLQTPTRVPLLEWLTSLSSADGQALGSARIESVGRDALSFSVSTDLRRERRYRIQLQIGRETHADLEIFPLWQSRVHPRRWRVGAVIANLSV
jgi:hypothetical protein